MDGRIRSIFEEVKKALFSNTNKEFVTFLFFVLISATFWLMQTLNEKYEETISIPVLYKDVPTNVVITSDVPENIQVTLQDNGYALLNYKLRGSHQPIVFNFEEYSSKGYTIHIPAADIQKRLLERIPGSSKLTSFKPEGFELVYTRGKAKKVPVLIAGNISAKQQYEITELRTSPDSVMIYAPQEVLDTINGMYINSVSYHELDDSLIFQADLRALTNVKSIPNSVQVNIAVEPLTEKKLEVPINAINVPAGKVLRTFPSKVTVTFQTILSYYKVVNSNNFIIQIDYNDIVRHPEAKATPTVLAPPIIKHLHISPQEVDCLLEDATE